MAKCGNPDKIDMNNPDLPNIGKKFSSEYQPENAGRKKNRFKETQKGFELSIDDMRQMMSDLLSLNPEELKAIAQDKETPVFKVVIASAIIDCIKKGNWTQVNYMADRLFGKATENVNLKAQINNFSEWVSSVSNE